MSNLEHIGEEGNIMKTEELAQWVEIQVPLGEYREDDPDLLPLAAERLRELAAEVERLKDELNNQECDTAYWKEQASKSVAKERAAIVNYLITDGQKSWPETKRFLEILAKDIEDGEHWPEGEDHG